MEVVVKSLVYNINLCRICQIPHNLNLINTSTIQEGNETYLDILKFIFNDIIWVQDSLLSVACTSCLKNVTEIAEFKRLCWNTNLEREIFNVKFSSELEIDALKVEYLPKVEEVEVINSSPDIDAPTQTKGIEIEESEATVKKPKNRSRCRKRTFSESNDQIKEQGSKKLTKQKTIRESKISGSETEEKLQEITKSKGYRCTICSEEFRFQVLLERHIFRHNGTRNYICAICGQKYITHADLNVHLKLHSGEYNYACDICPKKFKSSSNLKMHKYVVHSDPKDYKYLCTECGKKFSGLTGFKEHLNRHKQIRNFPCGLCDKSFVSKSEMQIHVISHSNHRQFKCDLCSAEYKRKTYLMVHKSKHHNIGNYERSKIIKKMYDCSFCGKSIAFKDKYERHIRTHTGLKPFQCRRCDTKFTCKSYIRPHYLKKHDINIDIKDDSDAAEYYIVLEIPQENNTTTTV